MRLRVRAFRHKPNRDTWYAESQNCLSVPHIGEAIDRHGYGVRRYGTGYSMPRELHHGHPIDTETHLGPDDCPADGRCLWLDTTEDTRVGPDEIGG